MTDLSKNILSIAAVILIVAVMIASATMMGRWTPLRPPRYNLPVEKPLCPVGEVPVCRCAVVD